METVCVPTSLESMQRANYFRLQKQLCKCWHNSIFIQYGCLHWDMLGMTFQCSLSQCALHVSASALLIPYHFTLFFVNRNDWFTHAPQMHRCCSESMMAPFFYYQVENKIMLFLLAKLWIDDSTHSWFHLGAIPGTGKSSDINWNSSCILFLLSKIFHCMISETKLYGLFEDTFWNGP